MHLKSSNGAIDVLVCPEDEAQSQCLQSSHSSVSIVNEIEMCTLDHSHCHSTELISDSTSHSQHHHHQLAHQTADNKLESIRQEQAMGLSVDQAMRSAYPQVTVTGPNGELDISLSSTADVNDDLGFMDHLDTSSLLPIDMSMFEHLSPPLQTEEFSFSMDNSTEGIHDLFDL